MTYKETLDFLYQQLPMFSRIGSAAYKKDLTNTLTLCEFLGHPQSKFKSIHIGGTNGKGSTTNYLASMFIEAGMKVGIYTSPHLIDFRERIKIGNQMVSEQFAMDFVERLKPMIDKIHPSFFELTVVMAFEYFALEKVDIAMIEVGLGGRLDSTNVIEPEMSIITNVSFDHMNMLGNTIPEIAFEKAGIIKNKTPCIIGESDPSYNSIFEHKAEKSSSTLKYASELVKADVLGSAKVRFSYKDLMFELDMKTILPPYQQKNIKTAICAFIDYYADKPTACIKDFVMQGIERRTENTGFLGRWTKLNVQNRTIILESAHNEAGVEALNKAIEADRLDNVLIIFGCVRDKDMTKVISLLPKQFDYVLSQANIPRAAPIEELAPIFAQNCKEPIYLHQDLKTAVNVALQFPNYDTILVTGSIFMVGEVLDILSNTIS